MLKSIASLYLITYFCFFVEALEDLMNYLPISSLSKEMKKRISNSEL